MHLGPGHCNQPLRLLELVRIHPHGLPLLLHQGWPPDGRHEQNGGEGRRPLVQRQPDRRLVDGRDGSRPQMTTSL
jgi:hypothetical protein